MDSLLILLEKLNYNTFLLIIIYYSVKKII